MRLAVLCILSIVLLSTGAWATTHHVPGEYATIQAGVDAASAGDTVLVAPGLYSDFEVRQGQTTVISACVFLKDGVVVRSEGGPLVTALDRLGVETPETPCVVYGTGISGTSTTLEGFRITGNPADNLAVTLQGYSGCVTIRNCIISNLAGGGVNVRFGSAILENCTLSVGASWGILTLGANLDVDNCLFEGNSPGIDCDGDNIVPPQHLTVRNSVFRNNTANEGAAIVVADYFDGVLIEGCTFENNTATYAGAILAQGSGAKVVRSNLFVNNVAAGNPIDSRGGALYLTSNRIEVEGNTIVGSYQEEPGGGAALFMLGATSGSFVRNNIFASSTGAPAIRLFSGQLSTSCNVFWNNELGEAAGFSLDPTDIIADPLFCDPPSGDYTVSSSSPCLPENNPNCADLIGAYGPGCGTVSIEPMSWGRLKGIYRTGE